MAETGSQGDTTRLLQSDIERYGKKAQHHLPFIRAISSALEYVEAKRLVGRADLQQILQEILPPLCAAFNSEFAFFTDAKLKVRFTEPKDSHLIGRTLPLTKKMLDELEAGSPLVTNEFDASYPELEELGIRSLLVTRLAVTQAIYHVGIGNSREEEGYLGEDEKLFCNLLKILGFGLRRGHVQKEAELARKRYVEARRRGEYDFISRASEDYAKWMLPLDLMPLREETPRVQGQSKLKVDDLIADYLDAELCVAMRTSHTVPRYVSQDAPTEATSPPLPDRPLDLVKLSQDRRALRVVLHDNQVEAIRLDPRSFPRTSLAVARIGLWAGYVKAGLRVPEHQDYGRFSDLSRELFRAGADGLFHTLAEGLLRKAGPRDRFPRGKRTFRHHIDWLRTLWQKMHYLANDGMLKPSLDRLRDIHSIYGQVCLRTAWIIRAYLEGASSQECLCIDSDWLAAWLTSNVLLSRSVAEYYGMLEGAEDKIEDLDLNCTPAEAMQYVACLSKLVLYTLHCTHHQRRKEELPRRIRDAVRRPPFADVPAGLSPSLTEAQLFVLSIYAYLEIGVHLEMDLFERLTKQLRHELPLYAASKFYRDHLYHVVDVCLLGELLLRSLMPNDVGSRTPLSLAESLMDLCGRSATMDTTGKYVLPEGPRHLLRNWYTAALCHDLGYVVEQARGLLNPIESIDGPGIDRFHDSLKEGLDDGEKELRQAVDARLPESPEPKVDASTLAQVTPSDHGIVAWLHINGWIDRVKEPPSSLAHALTAILRHNLTAQSVNIHREPLTLLLMLCDHLQEWGRPRVPPDPLARGVMESLRFHTRAEFTQKIRAHQLTVRGLRVLPPSSDSTEAGGGSPSESRCVDPSLRVRTQIEENLVFKVKYVEAREGGFEPAISWLWLCRDLQCLGSQDEKLPYNIVIELEHRPPRIWHLLPWRPLEMDLLQDFARQHERYLYDWIQMARRGDEGVHYEGDRRTGVEIFRLHLNDLGQPLRRGLSSEHWGAFFEWKWHELGQRIAKLNLGHWPPDF